MNPQPSPGAEPLDIGHICERECARHGWKLANEPALLADGRRFEQRVRSRLNALCAELGRDADESLVCRVIQVEYGCLLHQAMSLSGHRLQNIALEETMAYGWPVALRFAPDRQAAEDALTWALNLLWQNIHRCKLDKYFPYFIQILRNEIRQGRRKQQRIDKHEVVESDILVGEDAADEAGILDRAAGKSDGQQNDPFAAADLDLTRDPLIDLLRNCLSNERKLHIILNKFFLQLNVSEIAAQLRMTAAQVSVETHRALQRIRRNCLEFLSAELRLRLANS